MFFLLRVGFWLSIVILLLPTGETRKASTPSPQLSTSEAVSAAGAALADLRQICTRQPEVCEVGGQAAVAFGYKAQASAKMLYEFITEQLAPNETGSVAATARPKASASVDERPNETLIPSDLEPAWRGPTPLPRPSPLRRPA